MIFQVAKTHTLPSKNHSDARDGQRIFVIGLILIQEIHTKFRKNVPILLRIKKKIRAVFVLQFYLSFCPFSWTFSRIL